MPSDARLLLVGKDAVERLLVPGDVADAVREAFVLHSRREGRVFPVVREALPTGGIFGIKSGDVPAQGLLGFKAAGFWPGNRAVGGEPHQATILLFDPATGRPLCVIDGNAITTARTAAAGTIGLQALARPDSTRATVFGTGVQAAAQLDGALRTLPALRQVHYATAHGAADAAFEARFAGRCDLRHTADADAAVAGSDVVITATPGSGPLFRADAVRPGTHLLCVGADTRGKRELPEGLPARARIAAVDDAAQARQIGEMQWAPGLPCEEIGDLLTGRVGFTRQPEDITLFDMTGLALQDLTVARLVHRQALAQGLGTTVDWPW
ncbi:ornithine cyclodeaminase family protein [Acidovorax sp. GBBC 3334]|uniref:ornithine cyclodeaminase family protein n=1 Tax=Acidovorax sp. GBBC 3334 TaxID=2940496 RepID=UPI0023037D36|nr:ornithine cyclodeaminase family protein [Acidovorax sp. GBBC 3334]MDA8454974.1 ornithine cyclodeaminase family protein [Acidovorax sp. GBBC 3334]